MQKNPKLYLLSFQLPYQPLVEDHVTQPPEVQSFEGREDKQGLSFILLSLLDGSLWISDPHSGLRSHVLLTAFHWGLVQPATYHQSITKHTIQSQSDTLSKTNRRDYYVEGAHVVFLHVKLRR